jgi:DNA-binding transcriptional ArsR family regulator
MEKNPVSPLYEDPADSTLTWSLMGPIDMPNDTVDSPTIIPGFAEQMLGKATTTTMFLKAVSHPARLVLLCRLAEGPATVSEMEQMLGLAQAEVSKQLARLRADNLVTYRRDGRNVTYSIAEARTLRLIQVLHTEFCS